MRTTPSYNRLLQVIWMPPTSTHHSFGRHPWGVHGAPLNPRPTGGLFRAPPPSRFLAISSKPMQISPPNMQYPFSQQFYTLCEILKSRVLWFGHKWRQSDVMFRRFRPKIRVYGNRRHGCSFKATINCLIWTDGELVGLQNWYLGFSKFWKFLKNYKIFNIFFFFFKNFPFKIKIFKKPYNMLEGNGWCICAQNFKSISSKLAEIWHKTCQKQPLFTSFRDLTEIFRILLFDRFWRFKKCFRAIFRVLSENLTKNMYRTSKLRNFLLDLFLSGDLRWPWPLLWSQSTVNDTYKCQRHYPCRLVGFVCA